MEQFFQANLEMKSEGIRFNTLCPSITDTDLVRNIRTGNVINVELAKAATKHLGLLTWVIYVSEGELKGNSKYTVYENDTCFIWQYIMYRCQEMS